MKHWERIRVGLPCAYGCGEIKHAEWAYMHGRFAVCEPCAAKMGIYPPTASATPIDARDESALIPASAAAPRGFSGVGAMAESLKGAAPDTLANEVRRLGRKPRRRAR
jgi:hypothetical protein